MESSAHSRDQSQEIVEKIPLSSIMGDFYWKDDEISPPTNLLSCNKTSISQLQKNANKSQKIPPNERRD
jgi:hypothetical protein